MNMHENSPRSTFTYDLRLFLYNFAMRPIPTCFVPQPGQRQDESVVFP